MRKIILHIDLNAFFVRCEEIKNPNLVGKAVAIGGEGRAGIVSTCSYIARNYGIHSGMPMFQARMLCNNLIVLPGDYKFYELMSKEFISYVKKLTPIVEKISIDECYADITEQYKKFGNNNIYSFLRKFQYGLFRTTQLKCSIGVACTKFLAKMGSDYKKPMGITIIRNRDIPNILFPLPIKDYYGIGIKTTKKLEEINIHTIGDLYNSLKFQNDSKVESILGKFSSSIINNLEGKGDDLVSTKADSQKSIGTTRTLSFDTNDIDYLRNVLIKEFDRIYNELIKQNKLCRTIDIVFKNAFYDDSFKTKSFSKSLVNLTDKRDILLNETLKLYEKSYTKYFVDPEIMIRLIGISFSNLEDKAHATVQMTFENYQEYEKTDETILLINEFNRKAKKKILMRASEAKKNHGN